VRSNCSLDLQQQGFHPFGPGLVILFQDEDQIPQVMGITQSIVHSIVLEVRPVAVVHGGPFEHRKDANFIQGFAPSMAMDHIVGQQVRADHV
jgi:hypothetical protein